MSELTICIPSYREEENLRLLLPRVTAVLREHGIDAEVLVVDSNPPLDNTDRAVLENGARYLVRSGGNSYGDAVRSALAEVDTPYVLFMDADGSHTPELLPKLWAERDAHDVVIGSRYVAGGDTENGWILIAMSRIVNLTYAVVLGLDCADVSNSFKLYRSEQIRSLKLVCDNFDVIEEVLFKLKRRYDVRIKEVPFTFKQRMFGVSKRNLVTFALTYVFTLLRLRFFT